MNKRLEMLICTDVHRGNDKHAEGAEDACMTRLSCQAFEMILPCHTVNALAVSNSKLPLFLKIVINMTQLRREPNVLLQIRILVLL